mmetsp:Transcript_125905/g.352529  ORF Transcript_125905/g.352529 Transcript_125905/m.352529 type:complete len:197 (+) Transcript_125905:706-1296(+)
MNRRILGASVRLGGGVTTIGAGAGDAAPGAWSLRRAIGDAAEGGEAWLALLDDTGIDTGDALLAAARIALPAAPPPDGDLLSGMGGFCIGVSVMLGGHTSSMSWKELLQESLSQLTANEEQSDCLSMVSATFVGACSDVRRMSPTTSSNMKPMACFVCRSETLCAAPAAHSASCMKWASVAALPPSIGGEALTLGI